MAELDCLQGLLIHRHVVVLGGGANVLAALEYLLAARADVTVIANNACPAVTALAMADRIRLIERDWRESDLDPAWYVIAGLPDPAANGAARLAADKRRILCSAGWEPSGEKDPAPARQSGVALVGAGPGDPDLITVRGMRLLKEADVVVLDRLAPLELLAGLKPDVEVIDAAKIPYGRAAEQVELNEVMVERARAGKFVVRLKGGDPYLFGRGFEEVQACARAGLQVTVVPGVSSALAVPALAGVPVTHRGMTHDVTIVSGHLLPGHPDSLVDWAALGKLRGTLVVLMGVTHIAQTAGALIRGGKDPRTPALVVQEGARPTQRVLRSTVSRLGADCTEHKVAPPAVFVIGEVAALAPCPGLADD